MAYPTLPAGELTVWVGVGAPSSIGIDHISLGVPLNTGTNFINAFQEQAMLVDVSGTDYDVWVSRGAFTAANLGNRTVCLSPDAQ